MLIAETEYEGGRPGVSSVHCELEPEDGSEGMGGQIVAITNLPPGYDTPEDFESGVTTIYNSEGVVDAETSTLVLPENAGGVSVGTVSADTEL